LPSILFPLRFGNFTLSYSLLLLWGNKAIALRMIEELTLKSRDGWFFLLYKLSNLFK